MIKLERLQTKDGVTQLWECEKFEANFKYLSFAAICKYLLFWSKFAKYLSFLQQFFCKGSVLRGKSLSIYHQLTWSVVSWFEAKSYILWLHQEILLQFFNNLAFFLVKVLEFFFCPPSSSLCLCDRLLLLQNFLICVFWACADSKALWFFTACLLREEEKP